MSKKVICLNKNYKTEDFHGVLSTRQVHSRLAHFDATGYQHLGVGSNDTSACEIFQAHPADLPYIPKFI